MTLQSGLAIEAGVQKVGSEGPIGIRINRPRVWGGDVLAPGFAITVGVWVVAYVSRLPKVEMPGPVTVGGMLAVILIGGFLAARYSAKGLRAALWAGALSGMLDLIVVGSLIHDLQPADLAFAPAAALWVSGSMILNIVIASIGGIVGRAFPSSWRDEIAWGSVLAFVLVAATFLMLVAGGLVTAFNAGLAVPDWPRSFGYNMFLFPLSVMQKDSGKFFEHAHRLMGTLIGLTSFALAIYVTILEGRRWVKLLPWVVFVGVGIQGVLGGLRVTDKSESLAIVHGAFAQVVFALMAVVVVVTSRAFDEMPRIENESSSTDRVLTGALVGSLLIQLIFGTVLRHLNELLMLHMTMAALVTVLVLACGVRAWGLHGKVRPLRRSGMAVLAIVVLQIALGVTALVFWRREPGVTTARSAVLTTAHQVNGALLLASAAVLAVWTWRVLAPVKSPDEPPEARS